MEPRTVTVFSGSTSVQNDSLIVREFFKNTLYFIIFGL